MKKKALIYTLTAAVLLAAALTACHSPQADQRDSEPDPAASAAVQTNAPETSAQTTLEPTQTPAAPEQPSNTTQAAPDENKASQLPEETAPQEPTPVDPFTPVEETVYATGTVNIRSGPGTDYEKIGSLSWGEAVTRTGIGTGDYAKWSRVQLEDGREVYIATSYLSTTKPAPKQTTPSTGSSSTGSTQTPSSTGSQYADASLNGSGTSSTGSTGTRDLEAEELAQLEAAAARREQARANGASIPTGQLTDEDYESIGFMLTPSN